VAVLGAGRVLGVGPCGGGQCKEGESAAADDGRYAAMEMGATASAGEVSGRMGRAPATTGDMR
jgi:hypothetical protein